MDRLTEKTIGCFEYGLKGHKPVVGEFRTHEAFFDYSMAVRMLGKYEDTGLMPEEIEALKKSDASKEQCTIDQHNEIHTLRNELARVKAERDVAINDMSLMALAMRESDELQENCCFACRFYHENNEEMNPWNECPGYERDNCFEWHGSEANHEND